MKGSCQGAESGCGELPGRCVREKSERKQNQSSIAKKRKAEEEEEEAQQQAQASSARADAPSSSAAAFLGPDPTADAAPRTSDPQRTVHSAASSSGQPEARGHTTWSYNRDYYGMQREWSWYRGQRWYRDGAGGRWVLSFPNAACREHQKCLGKLPYLMCCDDWISGLSFYKRASIAKIYSAKYVLP